MAAFLMLLLACCAPMPMLRLLLTGLAVPPPTSCRLDLGGPLLANLFRALFRKLTKDVRNYLQASSSPLLPAAGVGGGAGAAVQGLAACQVLLLRTVGPASEVAGSLWAGGQ